MAVKKTAKKLNKKELAAKRAAAAKKGAATRARNRELAKQASTILKGEVSFNAAEASEDRVYYVVMERGVLSAKAKSLHSTRESATEVANAFETASNAPYNKFTVQRVELAD
jgi:hypothetical protein